MYESQTNTCWQYSKAALRLFAHSFVNHVNKFLIFIPVAITNDLLHPPPPLPAKVFFFFFFFFFPPPAGERAPTPLGCPQLSRVGPENHRHLTDSDTCPDSHKLRKVMGSGNRQNANPQIMQQRPEAPE